MFSEICQPRYFRRPREAVTVDILAVGGWLTLLRVEYFQVDQPGDGTSTA
jgi:hypothetical protein